LLPPPTEENAQESHPAIAFISNCVENKLKKLARAKGARCKHASKGDGDKGGETGVDVAFADTVSRGLAGASAVGGVEYHRAPQRADAPAETGPVVSPQALRAPPGEYDTATAYYCEMNGTLQSPAERRCHGPRSLAGKQHVKTKLPPAEKHLVADDPRISVTSPVPPSSGFAQTHPDFSVLQRPRMSGYALSILMRPANACWGGLGLFIALCVKSGSPKQSRIQVHVKTNCLQGRVREWSAGCVCA
jgi:hypothetical protein